MRRLLILRRYFLALWSVVHSLLSFLMMSALLASLLVLWQKEKIDLLVRWIDAEPPTRARLLETRLVQSEIVERVDIASVERIQEADAEAHRRGWLVSDASFLLASGIEVRFRTLSFLPRSVRVQGLQVLVPPTEKARATSSAQKAKREFSQEGWRKLVRQAGFFARLATKHTLILEDSSMLIEKRGQFLPTLRLRFQEIVVDNRNGMTWRGRGHLARKSATSRHPVVLRGSYASAAQTLYQSLRIENFSPSDMLSLIADNKDGAAANSRRQELEQKAQQASQPESQRWLDKKGQVSLDYRLDLEKRQSWFRMRFARDVFPNVADTSAPNDNAAISFDHSTDSRRAGLTNTSLRVHALPLGIVWQASDRLLPAPLSSRALPFRLEGIVSGRWSLRQQKESRLFTGNMSLQTPRFRWHENDESARAHRLTLTLKGSDEQLQIAAAIDFDSKKESGIDKTITILPYEEGADAKDDEPSQITSPARSSRRGGRTNNTLDPSKFRIMLEGSSRGDVPVQTVRALWNPRFKPKTRATVVEITKQGEITDLSIALDALIDRKAETNRIKNLQGGFRLHKGRLQLFAEPATLTEVSADARFTKQDILFRRTHARYGDFRIEDGEVSFERKRLANEERHTLMRLALSGEGGMESMRRFVRNAPFLQGIEAMQRSARWLPHAPRATVKGHFNLMSFLDQLDLEASDTVFPHPLSYDTAWQVEKIRLQAPVLRFYEASATLASSSALPLVLAVHAKSDFGATVKGRWQIGVESAHAVRTRQSIQQIAWQGDLDAQALASDLAYLPKEWLQKNFPFSLSYIEKAGATTRGSLNMTLPRSRFRLETSQTLRGKPVRIFGNIVPNDNNTKARASTQKQTHTQALPWQIEGTRRTQGKTSLVAERGGGKPLTLLLENLPILEGKTKTKTKTKRSSPQPAQGEWRLSLEGEELDLSRWLAQKPKPWRTFVAKKEEDAPIPSLGWGERFNLTFDARLKKLLLQKPTPKPAPKSAPKSVVAVRARDRFQQVHARLRWQDEKIRHVSFSALSPLFSRSPRRQRKQARRLVRTQVFYTLREGRELFSASIEDLGSFLHQALGKSVADGGRTQLSFVRPHWERRRPKPHFEGYAKVRNVTLYELPLLLKILDAADFISVFGKGIRGLDMSSDLQMWNGILTLKEFRLSNNLTALTANGSLDLTQRKLDLRGEIASLYFVSKILRNIPLIGTIVVGRKKHNLFAFSYEAKGTWDAPKVTASPFNILLPGIVKIANPLQLLERDDILKAQVQQRRQIAEEQKSETQQDDVKEEVKEEANKPDEQKNDPKK